MPHLNRYNLFSSFQSVYRPGHSTETALLKVVNDLLLAMDEGKLSVLVLLDLSAAFDTIDHDILLHRLQYVFDIQGTVLPWFRSYLTKRFQTVSIQGTHSDPIELCCDVPQGSVLGPILFILYQLYPACVACHSKKESVCVLIQGTHSDPIELCCGVPQGSVLGPIFLFFIHNLSLVLFLNIQYLICYMLMIHKYTHCLTWMIVCLLFFVLKSVYPMSKPG